MFILYSQEFGGDNQLSFTQGDTAALTLIAATQQEDCITPFNITGAEITTEITGPNGTIISFGPTQHTIINAPLGIFQLNLATTDTAACSIGKDKQILSQIVQGSVVTTFNGFKILTVNPDVPLQ